MKRYLPFLIIGLVLTTVAAVFLLTRKTNQAEGSQFTASPTPSKNVNSSPANASSTGASPYAPLGDTEPGADPPHVLGGKNAPVTLEEFGDFQCPACGALFRELKRIESEYGDKLRVIFRDYPITERHKNAMPAARAAEAAGFQNKFWEMHDKIYETQADWAEKEDARTIFINYARDLKLDMDRFTRDMDGNEADQRIIADRKRGTVLGVQGTPTLYINGRQLKAEAMTPELLRKAIDYMLTQK